MGGGGGSVLIAERSGTLPYEGGGAALIAEWSRPLPVTLILMVLVAILANTILCYAKKHLNMTETPAYGYS